MRSTSSQMFSRWRPDKQSTRLWLLSVVLTAPVWFYFLQSTEPSGSKPSPLGLSMLAVSAVLMGIASGSLLAAFVVTLQVLLGRFGGTVPLVLGPTALRVALVMYAVHVLSAVLLSVGLRSLGGHWFLPGPWYLGLLPYAWH